MKNKIIVIEGTDCSGKQTQSDLLLIKLLEQNIPIFKTSFPMYNSPTGKIISDCILGKGKEHSYFDENVTNVDAKVIGLYYAADRIYNISKIEEELQSSNVLLDRYVDSNLAHQGGKLKEKEERIKTYEFFENLEYNLLGLPTPDIRVLLFMPTEYSIVLRKNRVEALDEVEKCEEHLKASENAYLEIAERHNYKIINCIKDNQIRSIDDINNELFDYVIKELSK